MLAGTAVLADMPAASLLAPLLRDGAWVQGSPMAGCARIDCGHIHRIRVYQSSRAALRAYPFAAGIRAISNDGNTFLTELHAAASGPEWHFIQPGHKDLASLPSWGARGDFHVAMDFSDEDWDTEAEKKMDFGCAVLMKSSTTAGGMSTSMASL